LVQTILGEGRPAAASTSQGNKTSVRNRSGGIDLEEEEEEEEERRRRHRS
jgi:hypothetical protein